MNQKARGASAGHSIIHFMKRVCFAVLLASFLGGDDVIGSDVIEQTLTCEMGGGESERFLFSCTVREERERGEIVQVEDVLHNTVSQPEESWKFQTLLCNQPDPPAGLRGFPFHGIHHWGFTESEKITIEASDVLLQASFKHHKYKTEQKLSSLLQVDQGCGGDIRGKLGGVISSHGIENSATNCKWTIQAGEEETIQMTFTEFYVGNSPGCESEKLVIYDGNDVIGGNSDVINTNCGEGSTYPPVKTFLPLTSTRNTVEIEFLTQGSFSWQIEWTVVQKSGVPTLCSMYEGVYSDEMMECYNDQGTDINCEFTFNPLHENQTVLYVGLDDGSSTCYHDSGIDPSQCSDSEITEACDSFTQVNAWPPKVPVNHNTEPVKISHKFFACEPVCVSPGSLKRTEEATETPSSTSTITSGNSTSVGARIADLESLELSLTSKILIGCLAFSVAVNILLCWLYYQRFSSSPNLEADVTGCDVNHYVMKNNEIYATSPVTSLDDVTMKENEVYSSYDNKSLVTSSNNGAYKFAK